MANVFCPISPNIAQLREVGWNWGEKGAVVAPGGGELPLFGRKLAHPEDDQLVL